MKKHIVALLIMVLVLTLTGTGIWLVIHNNDIKPLYKTSCEFIHHNNTNELVDKITVAQTKTTVDIPNKDRLTVLQNIIVKIDTFEKDLNSYLSLSTVKAKNTKKLSKSYEDLLKTRKALIKNYDEYITRMSGDLNPGESAIQSLYNELFNTTVSYIYKYNDCFKSTTSHVFSKVYTGESIKPELYTLYSLGVSNLLNNISNNQFTNTALITRLNNIINLSNGNIQIVSTIKGGEFSVEALNFQTHFNNSNLSILIDNFNAYYSLSINPNVATSSEMLAVYYAKLILGV